MTRRTRLTLSERGRETSCEADLAGTLARVNVLAVVAVVLNVAGLALAAWALLQDWREYSRGVPLLAWWAKISTYLAVKVFRRSRGLRIEVPGIASHVHVSDSVRVTVTPGPDAPVERWIEVLRGEIEALHAEDERTRQRVDDLRAAVEVKHREALGRVDEVEDLARGVATGTLRKQMLGLVLVAAGTVAGALGALA